MDSGATMHKTDIFDYVITWHERFAPVPEEPRKSKHMKRRERIIIIAIYIRSVVVFLDGFYFVYGSESERLLTASFNSVTAGDCAIDYSRIEIV